MRSEERPDLVTTVDASFRTFEVVRKMLNHENRKIDYLKMDVEHTEWRIFEQIFSSPETLKSLDNIKQLALEVMSYIIYTVNSCFQT